MFAAEPEAIPVAPLTRNEPVDFNTEILPILRKHCLACHNRADADSDLVLESPATIRQGGSEGPAVHPGHGNESLLLQVAAHRQEPFMPPADNDSGADDLTPAQLGLIQLWIDQGAKGNIPSTPAAIRWQPLPAGVRPILATAMTDNGQYAACGQGNRLAVYHLPSGRLLQTLSDPALADPAMTSPAMTGPNATPKADVATPTSALTEAGQRPSLHHAAHRDLVQSLSFHPDGRLLASGGYETVKLWQRPECTASVCIDLGLEPTSLAVVTGTQIAAVGTTTGPIWLWDLATGQAVDMLTGHAGRVHQLSWDKQGAHLISCGSDRTVRVWDVDRHVEVGRLSLEDEVLCIALNPQETRLVTGGTDSIVRVWDWQLLSQGSLSQGMAEQPVQSLVELTGHGGPITTLATSASLPNQILSGSRDGTIRRWDLEQDKPVQTFSHGAPVTVVVASGDGDRLLSGGADRVVRLWNGADGQLVAQLPGTDQLEFHLARLQQQLTLQTGTLADEKEHRIALAKQVATSTGQVKKTTAALVAASKKRQAHAQRLADRKAEKGTTEQRLQEATTTLRATDELELAIGQQRAMTADPLAQLAQRLTQIPTSTTTLGDFRELLLARQTQQELNLDALQAQLHSTRAQATGQRRQTKQKLEELGKQITQEQQQLDQATLAEKQATTSVAQAQRENQRIRTEIEQATANVENTQQQLQSTQAEVEADRTRLEKSRSGVSMATFSPNNRLLSVGRENGDISIYEARTGTFWDRFTEHKAPLRGLQPLTENMLVSIDAEHQLLIWDANTTWQLQRVLTPQQAAGSLVERVLALDFSPDGGWLAAGSGQPSRSGVISLWRLSDGQPAWTLPEAHSDTVFSLEFSPDGKSLAAAAADRLAKVFRTTGGTTLHTFEGHTNHVLDVSWHADGKQLASAGADGRIKVWSLETGQPTRTIEGIVEGIDHEVTALTWRGVTPEVLSSAGIGKMRIHNMGDGKLVRTLDTGADTLYGIAIDALGQQAIVGGQQGDLQLWDLGEGKRLRTLESPKEDPASLEKGS
jgi:WD40 repeat protein